MKNYILLDLLAPVPVMCTIDYAALAATHRTACVPGDSSLILPRPSLRLSETGGSGGYNIETQCGQGVTSEREDGMNKAGEQSKAVEIQQSC